MPKFWNEPEAVATYAADHAAPVANRLLNEYGLQEVKFAVEYEEAAQLALKCLMLTNTAWMRWTKNPARSFTNSPGSGFLKPHCRDCRRDGYINLFEPYDANMLERTPRPQATYTYI